ncbi:MAG: protein kinase [Chthoniobacter sp.]|uniref:serine/threonine-protein kinase n=1 Tax=Chthoniobacter sp. TaxID=2510640 RepID=UPI0032AA913A
MNAGDSVAAVSMAAPKNSLIQECTTCGALLDVSGEEPFALMHCPNCGAATRVRRKFDHFEIQEELGAGGMGTVYRALDLNLNRPVALKLLQREHGGNPEFVAQFQKEASITASINHPHVVKVYSTGQDHGLLYIAMELVDKGSLESLMAEDERLPEVQILSVGIQTAQGLQAALDKGLIHRDIKPGNILFADANTPKIVDFGLAVLQEHAGHVAGEVWATPYYVAPETVQGKPEDFRSDMYSLGATLFHALAGKPPHEVETNSMSALAEAKKAPVNLAAVAPTVSSATAYALNKVLNHDPAKRQQSYAEFIEHLEFARAGLLGILPKDEKAEAAKSGPPRSYRWLTFATAVVTVAAGVSAFQFRGHLRAHFHPVEEQAETTTAQKETPSMTYDQARQLLAAGDLAKATEAFAELEARPDTQQPQKNWITLHAALVEFLAGRPDQANARLKQIEDRGKFSPDPAEVDLATFFLDVAARAGGTKAITAEAAKALDRRNYEALTLLLYGLKDWSLGEYDEASALFRQYAQVTPDSRFTWVGDYKPLVSPYVAEVNVFHPAMDAAKAADSLETRKQALKTVRDARAQIKLATGFAAPLDQSAQDLQQKITAEEEETARRMAEMEAADTKALTEAKSKIGPLWQQFRPADAYAVINAVQVSGDKAKQEREALLKKFTWLARFKATLIQDVNVVGYAPAVLKKSGTPMTGPIRRANDTQIETATPFGTISAQWTDLAPDSIIAMAKSFLRPDAAPDQLGERQWMIGVYAYMMGKPKDGHDLLVQASQAAPQHSGDLPLFPESGEAP